MPAADFQKILEKLLTKNLISTFAQINSLCRTQGLSAVVNKRESDFRMRQRVMRNEIRQMKTLCGF